LYLGKVKPTVNWSMAGGRSVQREMLFGKRRDFMKVFAIVTREKKGMHGGRVKLRVKGLFGGRSFFEKDDKTSPLFWRRHLGGGKEN